MIIRNVKAADNIMMNKRDKAQVFKEEGAIGAFIFSIVFSTAEDEAA
jgi:hypothetical protein